MKENTLCGIRVSLSDLTDEASDCEECSIRLKYEMANVAHDQLVDEEQAGEWKYFEDRAAQWADYPYRTEDID